MQRYDGDFLADLVAECHARGIRVIGGLYFDNATPVREHPDVKRVGRDGNPVKDRWGRFEACFNNPLARQHNLETVRHLLASYDLDGVILDDNFELDQQECFCDHCKAAFRAYCEERGAAYEDPAGTLSGPAAELWREHRREATRRLAAEVHSIAREHGVPAGGWVGASMGSMHLASVLDFLGGMVYTQPPRAARGPLLVLGERDFICLLWAPDADPARMEREVREAVHVGCAAVGFWIRGEDGGYEMDAERTAAMRRALGRVEQDWLDYYRRAIVGGDGRFAIVDGSVGPGELRLRLRNTGAPASRRFDGQIPEQFGPAH
ncbi:MAG: hypothetical protein AMK73_01060 [Planctomycetes bacterium SM23_32]|nr:MAG: hypothetical protein AMK73_01060 [Planctomycetes bacterium SM23_32]